MLSLEKSSNNLYHIKKLEAYVEIEQIFAIAEAFEEFMKPIYISGREIIVIWHSRDIQQRIIRVSAPRYQYPSVHLLKQHNHAPFDQQKPHGATALLHTPGHPSAALVSLASRTKLVRIACRSVGRATWPGTDVFFLRCAFGAVLNSSLHTSCLFCKKVSEREGNRNWLVGARQGANADCAG